MNHPDRQRPSRNELIAFPLIIALAWGINQTPLVGLLRGFHIWIHEFGHAGVAWFSGYKALPLPIGWTNIESTKTDFVYGGVLLLLGILFYGGWNERKPWAMIIAVILIPLQGYMTWFWPEDQYTLWSYWAGIGGEYIISTGMIIAYFMDFPDKFRWRSCRFVFLYLGASTFAQVFAFWQRAKTGADIPWGTLLHGHDDQGGDMNYLRIAGWSNQDIIASYQTTGLVCGGIILLTFAIACGIKAWREGVQLMSDRSLG